MGPMMLLAKKSMATKEHLNSILKIYLKNFETLRDSGYEVFEVNRIGRMMSAQAFFHEDDQFYRCVGIEAELTTKYSFQDEPKTETGFFLVWKGASSNCAPLMFPESYREFGSAYNFSNGCGDTVEISKILATADEVQEALAKLTKKN